MSAAAAQKIDLEFYFRSSFSYYIGIIVTVVIKQTRSLSLQHELRYQFVMHVLKHHSDSKIFICATPYFLNASIASGLSIKSRIWRLWLWSFVEEEAIPSKLPVPHSQCFKVRVVLHSNIVHCLNCNFINFFRVHWVFKLPVTLNTNCFSARARYMLWYRSKKASVSEYAYTDAVVPLAAIYREVTLSYQLHWTQIASVPEQDTCFGTEARRRLFQNMHIQTQLFRWQPSTVKWP